MTTCAPSRRAWLLALSATLAACGSQEPRPTTLPKSEPAPVTAPQTCDSAAESTRLLRRMAERPHFGNQLTDDGSGYQYFKSDGETFQARLVALDGPPLVDTPKWVLRVTRAGWIVLPTSDSTGSERAPSLRIAEFPSTRTAFLNATNLVELLASIDSSDVALAPDASAPSWLVDLTLAALASTGASKTTLLFEMKTPVEAIMRIPRGFNPDDGMDVIPSLFEDHRAICPEAYAAIRDNGLNRAPTKALRAMAKAVALCPCETDFALMDAMAFFVEGRLPLSSQVVQLTSEDAGSAPTVSNTPWLETYADTLAAAKRGPIVTRMPARPTPLPPPPPSNAGRRR